MKFLELLRWLFAPPTDGVVNYIAYGSAMLMLAAMILTVVYGFVFFGSFWLMERMDIDPFEFDL